MVVIGIDPGTAITGYGLLEEKQDGSLKVLDYGAILTPSNLSMPERLLQLYQQLKEILLLHRPRRGGKCFLPAMRPVGWAGARWLCWRWPNNVSFERVYSLWKSSKPW
jgi:hypothetical protein